MPRPATSSRHGPSVGRSRPVVARCRRRAYAAEARTEISGSPVASRAGSEVRQPGHVVGVDQHEPGVALGLGGPDQAADRGVGEIGAHEHHPRPIVGPVQQVQGPFGGGVRDRGSSPAIGQRTSSASTSTVRSVASGSQPTVKKASALGWAVAGRMVSAPMVTTGGADGVDRLDREPAVARGADPGPDGTGARGVHLDVRATRTGSTRCSGPGRPSRCR